MIARGTDHHDDHCYPSCRAQPFEITDRSPNEHARRSDDFGDAYRDADVLIAEPYCLLDSLFVAGELHSSDATHCNHEHDGCDPLEYFHVRPPSRRWGRGSYADVASPQSIMPEIVD